MNSLLWKEWHENRRYFAIFMAWMLLVTCYALGYEVAHGQRAMVGHFSGLASFYTLCATVFLAMRVAQGERTDGTLTFSAALPVSLRRVATSRIAGAVATLAVPILVAALLLSIALASGFVEQALPRDMTDPDFVRLTERDTAPLFTALGQLWCVTATAILGGVEVLLVLSLLGCRLRSQAQVGLLGAVLALGALVAAGVFWYGQRHPYAQLIYGALLPQSLVVHWGFGSESGSHFTDHEIAKYSWIALGLSLPVLVLLGRLFVTHYGALRKATSESKPGRFRFATPAILSHIPFRWPGRLLALVWLELRQSVPLATFGLLLALLMTLAGVMMEPQRGQAFGPSVLAQMSHSTWVVGMLWAAVVGSSLYSAELGAGLGAFWRSRPVPPGMWFWCKFAVGLVAVLGILDGLTILMSWNAPRESMTSGMSWTYVGCMPLQHAFLYALAVLGTCWLRKPVIGGFLAILAFAMLMMAISAFPATRSLDPTNIYNQLLHAERSGQIDFSQHGYPLVYGCLTASICLIALLSSRLARPLEPVSRWLAPSRA